MNGKVQRQKDERYSYVIGGGTNSGSIVIWEELTGAAGLRHA